MNNMIRCPRRTFFSLVYSLALSAVLTAQPAVKLDDLLSAPFPTQLTAAPYGGGLAWVINERGARNIMYTDRPGDKARKLTIYDKDDGQEITDLMLLPNASGLLFVRGGAPNRQGEIPAPTSPADWPTRDIWFIDLQGKNQRHIITGSQPILNPDGRSFLYLRQGMLYTKSLQDKTPGKQLFTIRGQVMQPVWSPDGKQLAFVSQRGDHSYVGVYHSTSRTIKYLSPSLDHDHHPVWSPDSRKIAFIREPHESQVYLFIARPEGIPWSIQVADLVTDSVYQAWQAKSGPGSIYQDIWSAKQMYWSGDHLVFPWEGDGYLHLYSLPASGGEARCLTPGLFEVQYVSASFNQDIILFSSNQEDADRQHIWQVNPADATLTQLTKGEGIEWAPVQTLSGRIAFMASGATTPAQASFLSTDGQITDLAPQLKPAKFPSTLLVKPEAVTIQATDGLSAPAQLFLPPGHTAGMKHPAVIFTHGGSRRQMYLGFHNLEYYHHTYALNQYLASQGFVVLSLNYRSGTGYGLKFREAKNFGADGASEFNDLLGAGKYLQQRADVEAGKIGLWGGSYGGYLTALGLARASDLFAAGVNIHGVYDWNPIIKNFHPEYNALDHPELAAKARASSPISFMDGWKSPVLIIHADDDRNVPFSESVNLVEALRQRNIEHELFIMPDDVHGFLLHRNWKEVLSRTAEFLQRKLKN